MRRIATKYTELTAAEIDWLELLATDWSLIADLALSDAVLWVPTSDGEFLAVAHSRPTGQLTTFHRDIIGDFLRDDWRATVQTAMVENRSVKASSITWYEEAPMQMQAWPVSMRAADNGQPHGPFAVVTLHTPTTAGKSESRMGAAYRACALDIMRMIKTGYFPPAGTQRGRQRGAPRAGDGLMRLEIDGTVSFASPNTLTSFARLGYRDEIEDEKLPEIVAALTAGVYDTNESLPLIAGGKIAARTDIEAKGFTITARSIPVYRDGERVGGIVLTRDITDIKQQAQELITKNATIREIHHRVKNNLQTVASLLRVQARRAESDEAKQVLGQAMRRVASIAVVHDALATGVDQIVKFDEVFDRVLGLAAEVASTNNTVVSMRKIGAFGQLPSEFATPLALALTEIVTNAVEHGLADREGQVTIAVERTESDMLITVSDDGVGLVAGQPGGGLGTQIIRTLIEGELGGTIKWSANEPCGVRVDLAIPLRWILGLEEEADTP